MVPPMWGVAPSGGEHFDWGSEAMQKTGHQEAFHIRNDVFQLISDYYPDRRNAVLAPLTALVVECLKESGADPGPPLIDCGGK